MYSNKNDDDMLDVQKFQMQYVVEIGKELELDIVENDHHIILIQLHVHIIKS